MTRGGGEVIPEPGTPASLWRDLHRLSPEARRAALALLLANGAEATRCFVADHAGRIRALEERLERLYRAPCPRCGAFRRPPRSQARLRPNR